MELRQLEHFVAVAEERHFTRAAEALGISQSGLSASVRALEAELDSPLFVRSTRRVELTEAGRAMLDAAYRILAETDAARDAVAAVRGVLRGTLRVGTEQCLGTIDLPLELAEFRRDHPGVQIGLRDCGSADLVDDVARGRLDLALVARCGDLPAGLSATPLFAEPMVVLCHPDHPLADLEATDLTRLHRETFVAFQPEWAARVLTARSFAERGWRYQVEFEVNDVHTLLDMVEHRLGIAIVPAHFELKRPGRLRAVGLGGEVPDWDVAVVVRDEPSPATRALLARLLPEAAGAVDAVAVAEADAAGVGG